MDTSQSILDICADQQVQKDPVSLRRIFLILTKNHFADPEQNFGGVPKEFKKFKYSDDDKEKTLDISLDYVFNNYELNQRPAIFVGFGDFEFSKQVLNNYLENNSDHSATGYYNMSTVICTIKHIAQSPDEALMLGTISTAFYRGIRSTLQENLNLRGFEVVHLSQPRLIDPSADKHFECELNMRLLYQDTWQTFTESHRIKKINYGLSI